MLWLWLLLCSHSALATNIGLSAVEQELDGILLEFVATGSPEPTDGQRLTERLEGLSQTIEAQRAAIRQHRQTLERQQRQLQQVNTSLEQTLSTVEDGQLLSRVLLELRRGLPEVRSLEGLASQIAGLRLRGFELERQVEDRGMATELPARVTDLIAEATALMALQEQTSGLQDHLRIILAEHLFWLPSNQPMNIAWLTQLPTQLQRQFAQMQWGNTLAQLWAGLEARPPVFLPLLLVSALLLWRRQWLNARVDDLGLAVGRPARDTLWHTPAALLLTALQALPVSLALGLCGLALNMDGRGQNASLGGALMAMAVVWLIFFTAWRLLAPAGVAEQHFRWPASRVAFLRRQVGSLGLVALALTAVTRYAASLPEALPHDAIGVLAVQAGFLFTAILLFRVAQQQRHRDLPPSTGEVIIGLLLAALPIGLLLMVALGYYFTALQLTERLIATLFLLVLWQLLQACLVRQLEVASSRLAQRRRQQAALSEALQPDVGEGAQVPVETPTLALDQVNLQSLRLLRLVMYSALALGLYVIWADLIALFAYLDNLKLWQYLAADGETLVAISLRDLLAALLLLGVAIALGRNLPGLLEVMVLSKLRLAQGSAYATTTLLSYVIFSVGFVISLGILGVSWDKLQWLVAALSVGLGFGLQEIFANFVSGLIILFERPIRIGDVVTLGTQSGIVKRIRIRATTISDFDRKDIIIPNKVFITGQLTNWSLTDTVTRVIVRVGVAYGSDLELTRSLLLQAARENPRVLADPEPIVYFLTFGASTLDHELRMHVRELSDRNPAIDEINRRIDALFREHGVEIAFNQVDVHLRSVTGEELHIAHRPAGNGQSG